MSPVQPATPACRPLAEPDIERLQALLDALPAPLEPLDVTMLDGYLCGVLLQPQTVPDDHWLSHVTDVDGRPLPAHLEVQPLRALVQRRHAELAAAIGRRQWFDPWVFELEAGTPGKGAADSRDAAAVAAGDAVFPWVAGFAAAMALFPAMMELNVPAQIEPLALLYRHLDPADLDDADELLSMIDLLEPPADLTQAVEELVRATLLLADVSRPQAGPGRAAHARPRRQPKPAPRSGGR